MTLITAQTHATLDGVIDAPPAEALLPYMSDAGRQGALDLALAADALLLPRETWQGLARAWRDQTGPMAERLNAMPKYVVSATLGSADEWNHTTIVGFDDIAGLREREQLLTYGCGRLARDLLADGLLDVLVLSLTPVVAGAGRRLFDDPGHLVRLRLGNRNAGKRNLELAALFYEGLQLECGGIHLEVLLIDLGGLGILFPAVDQARATRKD